MRRLGTLTVLAVAAATLVSAGPAAVADPRGDAGVPVVADWQSAGQNTHNTRYAATEHVIGRGNVGSLKPRWVFTAGGDVIATPAVSQGVVYVPDAAGTLWALRSGNGTVVWSKKISDYTGNVGDGSRTTPAVAGDLLVIGSGFYVESAVGPQVIGVDRRTGNMRWKTQVDTNPAAKVTGAPVIDNGVVYVGVSSSEELFPPPHTFRGSVVALSAATGRILWRTYLAPPGYTGNAVWGSAPAIDHRTGMLYITTGNNYTVPDGVCQEPDQTGCTAPSADDYFDSIVGLDLRTGAVRWSARTLAADATPIPDPPEGTDYDFGSMPNLFTVDINGHPRELVGAGQKSGYYWAVDAVTGAVVWKTKVGPGGNFGGIQWGSATDGRRIYVAEANSEGVPFTTTTAGGQQVTVTGGAWTALDPVNGAVLWQTPDPQGSIDMGYVSAANGVVYAGSGAGSGNNMYALDARTGAVLWGFASGGSVVAGAAVVNGSVYWGSGYYIGLDNNKLYAFGLG